MERTVVIDCFAESLPRYRDGYAIVAVDVIRATTTAVSGVASNRRCFPVPSIEVAEALAAKLDEPLLVGELGGNMPYGFDLTNSPAALTLRSDVSRPMVLLSTSGTRVLCAAEECDAVYAACLRNYTAQARFLAAHHDKVAVIGAGTRGEFREEDQMCCAWIAEGLMDLGYKPGSEQTAKLVARWHGAPAAAFLGSESVRYLKRTGQLADLDFILGRVDDLEAVFPLKDRSRTARSHPARRRATRGQRSLRVRAGAVIEPRDTSVPIVVLQATPSLQHGGPGIARTAGRLGIRVHWAQGQAWAPAALSRYVHERFFWDANAPAEASVEHLLGWGRRIGREPVLITIDDIAAVFVADQADALKERFLFPRQPDGLVRSLGSKKGLYSLCKKTGVPTPEAAFPGSADDVEEFAETTSFPVVLKLIAGWVPEHRAQTKSVTIVEDQKGLLEEYERMETPGEPNVMLQEYIPGNPEDVWMFSGFFTDDSECLASFTGKKIRQTPRSRARRRWASVWRTRRSRR